MKKQKIKKNRTKPKKAKPLNNVVEKIKEEKPLQEVIEKIKKEKTAQQPKKKENKLKQQIKALKKSNRKKTVKLETLKKANKKLQKHIKKQERNYKHLKTKLKTLKKAAQASDKSADNLKIIEGIGPKIEQLLNNAAIYTWKQLAAATEEELRNVLVAAGSIYRLHNPSSWPLQAKLASKNAWEELKQFQEAYKNSDR